MAGIKNDLEEFPHADTKGHSVTDCMIEALKDDDNGHRLLRVSIKNLKRGVKSTIELWDKRMVGDGENTQLTSDKEDYVWSKEQRRAL